MGKEAYLLPEFARMCPHPINEETTIEAQSWILREQMMTEGLYSAQQDRIIICDRASIDNFAYMQHGCEDQFDISDYERRAVQHMNTYAHVFKTAKLNIAAVDDGVRTTNNGFRDAIDIRIGALLEKHGIRVTQLDETMDYEVHVGKMMGVMTGSL